MISALGGFGRRLKPATASAFVIRIHAPHFSISTLFICTANQTRMYRLEEKRTSVEHWHSSYTAPTLLISYKASGLKNPIAKTTAQLYLLRLLQTYHLLHYTERVSKKEREKNRDKD